MVECSLNEHLHVYMKALAFGICFIFTMIAV